LIDRSTAQDDLQAAVDRAIEFGEVGLQVCVVLGGTRIVDVAGGWRNRERGELLGTDGLVTVFSATKGVLSAAVLAAAASGWLDLDRPVAAVWPEFGAAGKDAVTARQLLTHTAGIPLMPPDVSIADMCDWTQMTSRIATLRPIWPAGVTMGYHAYTFGWAVGELLRRAVDPSATLPDVVRALVLDPTGAEGFWLGIGDDQADRVAELYRNGPAPVATPRSDLAARAIPPALATEPVVYNRADVRRACLPAAGGISNARSLAAVYAMLATDGAVGDKQVIPAAWVHEAASVHRDDVDQVTGLATARGLGFIVSAASQGLPPFDSTRSTLGHPGAGGSIAWADRCTGSAAALTRTALTRDGWRDPVVQELIATVNQVIADH
jgi:CubicO group peptidase (beta-lactamase class C family)